MISLCWLYIRFCNDNMVLMQTRAGQIPGFMIFSQSLISMAILNDILVVVSLDLHSKSSTSMLLSERYLVKSS